MTVVTRFAPSPTGHLHIGGVRTAIFCWLLARHFGGKFLLRIEDTDRERSKQEYTDSILASMHWLGLDPDEPPVFQSRRMPRYAELVERLVASGHAYWCSCQPDEVEAMREQARAEGAKPRYNGRCRDLGLGPGPGRAVRLKTPLSGEIVLHDAVKGDIAVDASELDDMVIFRSDGTPTYNMAVVADDIDMGVTHVIRGDDHVSNTHKQILLFEALGSKLPVFGHVPMILGPDKQKLSKRHGAKAAVDYQRDGLLPEALVNYLVRLGWSHGDQELFTRDELIKNFDGHNMSRAAASFDPEKLLWVNAHHLRETPVNALAAMTRPFLAGDVKDADDSRLEAAAALFRQRAATLVELAGEARNLLLPPSALEYAPGALEKALTPDSRPHLAALRGAFTALADWTEASLHDALNAYVTDNNLKFKAIGPVLRVAVLASLGGPGLPEAMAMLGREETLARMDKTLARPL
ncbi:MAG: glutamate--tRNA ligase [Deltaproteobacteria bacterium]|nr:glutamate--tRNA ligase [Deltaproteobacteria bacterium]